MKPQMACRWRRLLPSLKRCEMNGTNGCQHDGGISPRKTGKSVPSVCQCGQIKCCKKSSARYWRLTLSRLLAITHTGFAQDAVVTPLSGKSITRGLERPGLLRETFPNVST